MKDFFVTAVSKVWRESSSLYQGQCIICEERPPQTPYCDASNNCRHQFCYYCIKQKLMEQNYYTCRLDGTKITNITRYQNVT